MNAVLHAVDGDDALTFVYCRGADKYDASPVLRTAPSFEAFRDAVLADRSRVKGQQYVCAPMREVNGSLHRGKDDGLPRVWQSFDLDKSLRDMEAVALLNMYLCRFQGFGWFTHSHKPDAPRLRIIVALSREVARAEGIRLGLALEAAMRADVTGLGEFDRTVYRAEQPVFCPPVGAETFRFEGEPVDVDYWLEQPLPDDIDDDGEGPGESDRAETIASTDPVVQTLLARKMVHKELELGKLAVLCPFDHEHTSTTGDTSTVYFLPHFAGVRYGKFHCLHSHCESREQKAFLEALGLVPREVWREQQRDERAAGDESGARSTGDRVLEFVPISTLGVTAPRWLIKDVIELDTVGFLYGDSETAKTLIGVDWAACVALGIDWCGHPIKARGSVIYVLGEGHGGIARRRAAWERHHGRSLENAPLFISKRPGDFFTRQGIDQFLAGVEALIAAGAPPPVLVEIDTMSRNVGDGFEETTDGVRALLNHVNEHLRARWGCAVLMHHHVGHMEKDRMRGPRMLTNNTDFAFRTERPEKDGPVLLVNDRLKDGRKLPEMAFQIVPVDLGLVDDDRQPVYGVTVSPTDYSRPSPDSKGMGKSQDGMLMLLRELHATARANVATSGRSPDEAKVAIDWWREAGVKRGLVAEPRQAFHRVKAKLLERALIQVSGKFVAPVAGEESTQ